MTIEREFDHLTLLSKLGRSMKTPLIKEYLQNEQSFNRYIDFSDRISPGNYNSRTEFERDYLFFNLFSKYRGWTEFNEQTTLARAKATWYAAESQCKETNLRLQPFLDHNFSDHAMYPLVLAVRRKIKDIVKARPNFSNIVSRTRTSNGATASHKRGSTLLDKINSPTSTSASLRYIGLFTDFRGYNFDNFKVVEHGVADKVPKNCKTDRIIDMQPSFLADCQQGIGRELRDLLYSFGVDLSDQSVNQNLAFSAIVDDLCTLDLKTASDTVALLTVPVLFPAAWSDFLLDMRTASTVFRWDEKNSESKPITLEKFSAMGNAFTFELESTIFTAITSVISEAYGKSRSTWSVYGDDIICHRDCSALLVKALSFFGFTLNVDKSFIDGRFFESCGVHFFDLENVTPAYQKEQVTIYDPITVIRLHNRIYRWGVRTKSIAKVSAVLYWLVDLYASHYGSTKPSVPIWSQRDDGFIDPSLPNNDCRTNVIRKFRKDLIVDATSLLLEHCLMRPHSSMSDDKGYPSTVLTDGWVKKPQKRSIRVLQRAWHWYSVTGTSLPTVCDGDL